jgi:predicted Ser/Thr protein kinase
VPDAWQLLVFENDSSEIKIVRVLAKGTTGALYVAVQNQILLFNEFYLIAY